MSKRKTRPETVEEMITRIMSGPHHPANCPAKGMFGADCGKCDVTVKPDNKVHRVAVEAKL